MMNNICKVNNLSGYSEDGRWHNLKVEVIDGVCKAYVDGNLFINYEGEALTKSVGDIALGASASATWRVKATVSDIECLKNYTVGIVLSFNSSVIDNSDVMPVVLHKGEQEWATTEHKHVKAYNCCGEVVVAEENHEWENSFCRVCGNTFRVFFYKKFYTIVIIL